MHLENQEALVEPMALNFGCNDISRGFVEQKLDWAG